MSFSRDGYEIWMRSLNTNDALRRLMLEFRASGATAEQIAEWSRSTWWPHLRWSDEVLALQEKLPLPECASWAEPQIAIRPPDFGQQLTYVPHVDEEPDWAKDRGLKYGPIYGVTLTKSIPGEGALLIWPFQGEVSHYLPMQPGDVLVMHPQLPHAGTLNLGTSIRAALYFRTLVPEDSDVVEPRLLH